MTKARNQQSTKDPSLSLDTDLNGSKVFDPKVIKKGAIIFVTITLISLVGIFIYTTGPETVHLWSKVSLPYLLIGLLFIINDLYLGGLRNHIFIREFVPGISIWESIKANLANIFMGAMTPSQSGGGLAQLYVFHRNGVSISDNISNGFFNWISTLIFFPLSGWMAIYILDDAIPKGFVTHLTRFGFSIFTTLLIAVIVGLFSPSFLGHLVTGLGTLISVVSKKAGSWLSRKGPDIQSQMIGYRRKYADLIKTKPQLMVYSFLLTIVLYFNKYALAYIFCLAFGLDVNFWVIISIMAVLYLLLYFAPSPGGSGIAEVSLVALLGPVVGADIAGSITLLHRSFLIYIPALIGAWVTIRQVSKE